MRSQLGRNGDGEHFAVIAYGSTPGRLLQCLEARARAQGRNDLSLLTRHTDAPLMGIHLFKITGQTPAAKISVKLQG